jgi:hypothetical protein
MRFQIPILRRPRDIPSLQIRNLMIWSSELTRSITKGQNSPLHQIAPSFIIRGLSSQQHRKYTNWLSTTTEKGIMAPQLSK